MGNADLPPSACAYGNTRGWLDVGSTNCRRGHRPEHTGLLNFRLHGPVGQKRRSVEKSAERFCRFFGKKLRKKLQNGFAEAIKKSFCGVKRSFFQKAPLVRFQGETLTVCAFLLYKKERVENHTFDFYNQSFFKSSDAEVARPASDWISLGIIIFVALPFDA